VEINRGKSSIQDTKDAIHNKRGIIFQAAMQREHFRGYADFLMLNPEGEYEIWDTKLSRNMKSYYYVQLCCYAEMLEEITGKFPTGAGIILGNFTKQTVNLDDHFEDYLKIKNEFLHQMENWDSALPPDPLPNADHSDWSNSARKWMIKKDHLCLVASIRVSQIQKLNDAGITTVQQLASTHLSPILNIFGQEMSSSLPTPSFSSSKSG
jgi:predicted RecB family nuclease